MLKIAAVVLDFDGLILDTESPIYDEWREEFQARGHQLQMADWQRALGSHGAYDPMAHLHELCGGGFEPEELRLALRQRILRRCDGMELLPGVRDLLEGARARGLRRAVASSSSSEWVTGWLERHQLTPLVETVCARDHVERVKPAPDLFLLAASRLGVEPGACVVFEDSPNGVRAARAAGMRCVAVPNAVTRGLAFDAPDLVVGSLADQELGTLLERLGG